ncbi:MAG: phosphoenolpyruvate carboxykinase (GTP), partial [Proteobacteria bacterium]|nr:phosphoenolpyruvate carboxykinase (GTP) [Pseudomonadota bacterium]
PVIFHVNYFLRGKDGKFLNGIKDKHVWLKWMEMRTEFMNSLLNHSFPNGRPCSIECGFKNRRPVLRADKIILENKCFYRQTILLQEFLLPLKNPIFPGRAA